MCLFKPTCKRSRNNHPSNKYRMTENKLMFFKNFKSKENDTLTYFRETMFCSAFRALEMTCFFGIFSEFATEISFSFIPVNHDHQLFLGHDSTNDFSRNLISKTLKNRIVIRNTSKAIFVCISILKCFLSHFPLLFSSSADLGNLINLE